MAGFRFVAVFACLALVQMTPGVAWPSHSELTTDPIRQIEQEITDEDSSPESNDTEILKGLRLGHWPYLVRWVFSTEKWKPVINLARMITSSTPDSHKAPIPVRGGII